MVRDSRVILRFRDQRSRVWTTTTSNSCRVTSSSSFLKTGRRAMASTWADFPSSRYIRTGSQPRFLQSSLNSRSWASREWPSTCECYFRQSIQKVFHGLLIEINNLFPCVGQCIRPVYTCQRFFLVIQWIIYGFHIKPFWFSSCRSLNSPVSGSNSRQMAGRWWSRGNADHPGDISASRRFCRTFCRLRFEEKADRRIRDIGSFDFGLL